MKIFIFRFLMKNVRWTFFYIQGIRTKRINVTIITSPQQQSGNRLETICAWVEKIAENISRSMAAALLLN